MIRTKTLQIMFYTSKKETTYSLVEKFGVQYLSNTQLVASILGIDILNSDFQEVKDLFSNSNSLRKIDKMSILELLKIKGIGKSKALSLLSAFELGKRVMVEKMERTNLGSSLAIHNYMYPLVMDLEHEEFYLLCMDQSFRLLKRVKVSIGGLTETTADIRIIIKEAVMCNSTIIAVIHNHPSTNPNPSKFDDELTKQIQKACNLMRIYFMDHIIISSSNSTYYSYHDKGRI